MIVFFRIVQSLMLLACTCLLLRVVGASLVGSNISGPSTASPSFKEQKGVVSRSYHMIQPKSDCSTLSLVSAQLD